MSLNDLNPKLTPRQIEIAIEAIGRRATGSPAEAALQILLGIAAFDGGVLPAVAWPEGYSLIDKAQWHTDQAKSLTERHLFAEELMSRRPAEVLSPASCPGFQDEQYHSALRRTPAQVMEADEARREEPTEVVPDLGKKPDLGASDAYE